MKWNLSRSEQRLLWSLFFPMTLVLPSFQLWILVAVLWPVVLACTWLVKYHLKSLTEGNTEQVRLAALVGGHFALLSAVIYVAGAGLSRLMLWLAAQKIAGIVTAAVIATMSVTLSHSIARTFLDQTTQAEAATWSDSQARP
jgi:hypothetical protein